MKTLLFCFFATTALFIGGCTKDGTIAPQVFGYDDDYTVDGGSYHDNTINIKTVNSSSGESKPNNTTYTEVQLSGSSDTFTTITWDIKFNSTSTGTVNFDKTNNTVVTITVVTKNNPTQVVFVSDDNTGSVDCTQYDNVGGKIKGSFNGKFDANGTTYTIKGSFSVKRTS